MSLMSRLAARTPEEAERRRFALWAGLSLIVLLPLWWIWGADVVIGLLRPLAGLVFRLFGLTGEIGTGADGAWMVGTPLTQAGQPISLPMDRESLRRMMLGFPLLAAFMIAPPRVARLWRAAAIAVPVLCLVFMVSVALSVWGDLAPMLSPDLASETMTVTMRPDQPPLHPFVAQVVIIGRYVAYSIAPLLTALILWATLNPEGLRTLVAEIKE
ncbi:exosortase H-associated membrane protein [Brevundimonas staleyi]|uniref:Exosortase H-associated membrane protein n=1 Tax=Brevundimonas staleyi TaxID=74326 RepID=A0ABW0FT40_9CAUL